MANFRFKEGEGGRLNKGEGGRLDTKERHSPNKEKVKGINTSGGGGGKPLLTSFWEGAK